MHALKCGNIRSYVIIVVKAYAHYNYVATYVPHKSTPVATTAKVWPHSYN